MPKALPIGKPKTYTVERLQELRREADLAGDKVSRDAIAAKILAQGGEVPTGVIPADETKMSRLERLRQDALDVSDTASAEALAVLIAGEAGDEPEPDVVNTDLDARTPLDGGMNIHTDRESDNDAIARLMKDSSDKLDATVAKGTDGYEAIDLECAEGPIATQPVNNGKASVNAQAMITREGYRIDEVPARFGGKLDVTDVKHYKKLLTQV